MKSELEKAFRVLDDETRQFQQSDRDVPRIEWRRAFEHVVDLAADPKQLNPEQFPFATALINKYLEFLTVAVLETQLPSNDCMAAMDGVRNAKPVHRVGTEPLADLAKMPGMSHEQMARMHGLSTFDIVKILSGQMEYPKNHTTPEQVTWDNVRRQEAKDYQAACMAWKEKPANNEYGEPLNNQEDNWSPPPEGPLELLQLPGMTIEQVARMHRMSVEEIDRLRNGSSGLPSITGPEPTNDAIREEVYTLHDKNPKQNKPEKIAQILGIELDVVNGYLAERQHARS